MIKRYVDRKLLINNKTHHPLKDVLIFDIETRRRDVNKRLSASNSELVIWGAYSYNTGTLHFGTTGNAFSKLMASHKVFVGHNIKGFDIPVLKQEGCDFNYKKIVDLLELMRDPASKKEKEAMKKKGRIPINGKGRSRIIGEARIIGMKDNRFPDFKLSTIMTHGHKLFKDTKYKEFFEDYKQEEFDYDILQKKKFTDAETLYIKKYLRQDIVVTKNFFEFLEKYFEGLAHYLPPKDIDNLEYVVSPTGKYAYKVICNKLGLPEEYGEALEGSFPGAFVFLPTQEEYGPADGDGYCIDFNSQHPSHQRMMNLFSPASKCKHKVKGKCPTAHKGDGRIFKLLGTYCACEQGPIEKIITQFYLDRLEFKAKKDPREYTVKIVINTLYGISSSAIFKSIFNKTTGPDTTRMSEQSTKFMARWMKKYGYIITYGDTDSLYIMDPFKDKARMERIRDKGIEMIKDALTFPDKHYGMGIDAEFSHIYFFEDEESKDKHYKKKNYIYIKKDGKVKINGLPILKRNAPKLAKKLYTEYLEKEIKRTKKIKFDKEYLKQLIDFEVENDMTILSTYYKVGPAASYTSPNQIQANISRTYLKGKDGAFTLIKHKRKGYGIGKSKFYCSLEEAKKLHTREYDLDGIWKTINPFVKKAKQTKLGDY